MRRGSFVGSSRLHEEPSKQVAVDISLYRLSADYVPPIMSFIERLGRHSGLDFEYTPLSTQVRGDIDAVFAALKAEAAATFAGPDRSVLVMKMIGGTPTSGSAAR